MRDISKRLTVINTEKKDNASDSKGQSSGVTYVGLGGGGMKNLNDYLLKSIWDRVWEIRTDSQGTEYIFGKLPVVTQYGITMYSGENTDIPTIAEGLPFDNRTIWFNPETNQIEVIGGTGGGSGEGVSNFWDLSGIPSWITNTKPTYSYSEIQGTPDLSVYALKSDIPSLSGYATEQWVLGKGFALSSDLAKYIPIEGATDITGEKNFTGGLKVNGSPIYYDEEKKYWKLDGDLLVTGGVTMYGNDSDFVPSTIMDAILYDDNTLGINDKGQLYVKGSVGGATTLGSLANVGSWADSVSPQDRIMYQAANSSQWVAKNLSDLAVGGVTGNYLPLTGGELSGSLAVTAIQNGYWAGGIRIDGTTEKPPSLAFHIANLAGWRLYMDKNQKLLWENSSNGQGVTSREILHTSNYSSYALPLSGGTINGSGDYLYVPLYINALNNKISGITFKTNGAERGHVGYSSGLGIRLHSSTAAGISVSDSDEPIFYTADGAIKNTIWHAGNDGSGSGLDADMLDGLDSIKFYKEQGRFWSSYATSVLGNGSFYAQGYSPVSGAYTYGSILNFKVEDKITQFYITDGAQAKGTGGRLFFRDQYNASDSITSRWIEVITSENIENQAVASATKLQTPRTIWGQSFDGTGDIGNKSGSDASSIRIVDNRNDGVGGYQAIRFYYDTDNQATIHYFHNNYNGLAWTTKNLNIDADYITLGSWNNPAMIVNRNTGNIGIGTTNPIAKLQVEGLVRITAPLYGVGLEIVKDANDISSINLASTSTDFWQISARYTSSENGNLKIYYYDGSTWANPLSINKSGNILVSGGITMYSARKLKTIQDERGLSLEELSVIKPTRFTWKDGRDNKIHIGGIADDVQKVLPEVIYKTGEDDTLTMDYGNAAFAIAASLIKPVITHEEEIKVLKNRIKELEEQVKTLSWNIA